MKNHFNSRRLVYLAVWSALTVVLGIIVKIPTHTGILAPMCDVGVFLAAFMFGARGGFAVGAMSGFLIDLFSGYPTWMFFSFIIHGLQGFVTGKVAKGSTEQFNKKVLSVGLRFVSLILGGLVMVVGYALAGSFLYGWRAAVLEIPSNLFQTGVGIGAALVMEEVIRGVRKFKTC